jgi:hypothetical protein
MMFKLSDHVSIAGGMLHEYGVRLDGLTGLITSSRHDAPPGTLAVYVDWAASPYADRADELPKWVNVPPQFLSIVEDESTPPDDDEPQNDAPFGGLRLVN